MHIMAILKIDSFWMDGALSNYSDQSFKKNYENLPLNLNVLFNKNLLCVSMETTDLHIQSYNILKCNIFSRTRM